MTARRLRFFVRVWTAERLFLSLAMQLSRRNQDHTADKKTKSHSDSRTPRAPDTCSHALTITASFSGTAIAMPARRTGNDQARSPSHDTAAAPTRHPTKNPITSCTVFLNCALAPAITAALPDNVSKSESVVLV